MIDNKYTNLYEKLASLQGLLQRYHMMNNEQRGPLADTTRGQGRVMAILRMQPEIGISTKDLSYLLGIRVPSLNELLMKLEKGGYILREPSETDKRVMLIRLTEKGMMTEPGENDYSDIFDFLSDDDINIFSDYLDGIIEKLASKVGDEMDDEELETWMKDAEMRMGSDAFQKFMYLKQERGFNRFDRRRPFDRRNKRKKD